MNIAIFASGNGSNFQAIVDASKRNKISAKVCLLVCDNPKAFVLERAKKADIRTLLIKPSDYPSKEYFEKEIAKNLKQENISLIVLAGFMRMLGPAFVKQYKNKIINIHPALLPAFKGSSAIKDAFDYGVKVTGVTIHFVDEKMDHGPIILQEPVKINPSDTLESLEAHLHSLEHKLYPKAIELFVTGKLTPKFGLKTEGRKVIFG